MNREARSRRRRSISAAVAVFLLALQSIAWACTGLPTEKTTVTPTEGGPGDLITAIGRELLRQTLYDLWLASVEALQGTRECGEERIIAGPTKTSEVGYVSVEAAIPPTTPSGTVEVWFARTGNAARRGPSAFFTVLGNNDCDDDVLYRSGNNTFMNFTPRPVNPPRSNDVEDYPDNGLSTYSNKAKACEDQTKVQLLDPTRLVTVPGLQLHVDSKDPEHIYLQGTDEPLHLAWAGTRETAKTAPHDLARGVQAARTGEESCP